MDENIRMKAIISLGGGYFAPRDIKTGISGDGYVQVLDGLHEGENIVTSSQFLIDSESNLKAAVAGMVKKDGKEAPAAKVKKAVPVKQLMNNEKVQYTCEMHPGIIRDKPGDCPLCGMKLIPIKKPKKIDKIQYTCEMHPEIVQDKPGNCPLCGMTLVPKK